MALRPAVFDRQILSLHVAGFAQSLAERGHKRCRRRAGRPGVEDADHRHRLLLRAAGQRPQGRRAAQHEDQLASSHTITSSAAPTLTLPRMRGREWEGPEPLSTESLDDLV